MFRSLLGRLFLAASLVFAPACAPMIDAAYAAAPHLSAAEGGTGTGNGVGGTAFAGSRGSASTITAAIRAGWRPAPQDWGNTSTCNNFSVDDTPAVQAAITALESASGPGGFTLYVDGQCKITGTLNIAPGGSLSIICPSWFAGFELVTSTPGTDFIHIGSLSGARVSNASIRGCGFQQTNTDATNWVVQGFNVGSLTLEDNYVFGNNKIGNAYNFTDYANVRLSGDFSQSLLGTCVGINGSTSLAVSGVTVGYINAFTITGGTGGTAGTYIAIPLTGGTGTGAVANITVAGGAVTAVATSIPDAGNYTVGDVLTATGIGGVTGFSITVTSVGIQSADFFMDKRTRCDSFENGLVQGDFVGGVYVEDTSFYHGLDSSAAAFKQTSTVFSKVLDSYHFVGNDFDSMANAMQWVYANDAHIVGNRFGFNTTNVLSFQQGKILEIAGNVIKNGGATNCIDLGSLVDGIHTVTQFNISANVIGFCHFGINGESASVGTIGPNTFVKPTSSNIAFGCNDTIALDVQTYDTTANGGTINTYGCAGSQLVYAAGVIGNRLGQLRGANMNSTADQAIRLHPNITAYNITSIQVTNCSASITTAAGGFYSAVSKGGTNLVASSQTYTGATTAAAQVIPTLTTAALTSGARLTAPTIYFSLTGAEGSAATCDIYLFGNDLS